MYKDIEFVCSGNMDRSPLAEAFAKKYFDQRRLASLINVSSSGTLVGALENLSGPQLAKFIEPYIPPALERGFMSVSEAQQIRGGLRVKEIVSEVKSRVKGNNERKIRKILEEKGLLDYFDFNRKPTKTVERPEAELIFPIDKKNYKRVAEIYYENSLDHIVMIVHLGDIEDPFFATLEEHRKIADEIERATIEKLDRFLE